MAISDPCSPLIDQNPTQCTVTFGRSTFLGRFLVSSLLSSGHWVVRVADTSPLDPSDPPQSSLVTHFQTDFSDRTQLLSSISNSAVVFHVDPTTTSAAASLENFAALHSLGVRGTGNLISACREAGVRRLVYTGSADVVFDGVREISSGDESLPYPDKFEDVLNELRAQIEMMVLSANGVDGMWTCALRPSNPFGPGDSHILPFFVGYARSVCGKLIVGSGQNMCDFTYVENVVHANICAERALQSDSASIAGKPFFVTNDEPVKFWEFFSSILEGLGYQRPTIHLPIKLVLLGVVLTKLIQDKLGLYKTPGPLVSPAIVHALSCTRTFSCSNAKRLLGYSPVLSLEDGVTRTVDSFSELAKNSSFSRERDLKASKADQVLGSGVAANILLWRDEKKTFASLVILFMMFYWFLLSGRTFISSAAKVVLLVSVTLFIHGILPSSMFGMRIEKVPSACFEVSESTMRNLFTLVASIWNEGFYLLKVLAKGDDWELLFKAAASLYFLKLLFHFSLAVLVGAGLTCMFTIFIVYEQCEEEVDRLVTAALVGINYLKRKLLAKIQHFLPTYVSQN
ncbi:3beta-hydroxysteroid-dehydrogenase/decarboxylase [Typha angustifolia]|uniref:3beta-hydroxysteroid- dehydrogenase/decarboxylase n=1 Tax=Typha angustifolia TaxID=59011 RepID=UPI003C2D0343